MGQDEILASIELLGRKVLPVVRRKPRPRGRSAAIKGSRRIGRIASPEVSVSVEISFRPEAETERPIIADEPFVLRPRLKDK